MIVQVLFQSCENLSEFEFKILPISCGKSLESSQTQCPLLRAAECTNIFQRNPISFILRSTHGFFADKMYFPPNKSMKPDFINFIVKILQNAFWNTGFHQVP